MANQAAKAQKDADKGGKEKQKDVRPVPEFRDKNNELNKLKRGDFPKSTEGKIAHAQYGIEVLKDKIAEIKAASDPKKKKAIKLAKMRKTLAALEKEVKDDE